MIAIKVFKYKILEYCLEVLANKMAKNLHLNPMPATDVFAGRRFREISQFSENGSELIYFNPEIQSYDERTGNAKITCETMAAYPPEESNIPPTVFNSGHGHVYNVNLLNAIFHE